MISPKTLDLTDWSPALTTDSFRMFMLWVFTWANIFYNTETSLAHALQSGPCGKDHGERGMTTTPKAINKQCEDQKHLWIFFQTAVSWALCLEPMRRDRSEHPWFLLKTLSDSRISRMFMPWKEAKREHAPKVSSVEPETLPKEQARTTTCLPPSPRLLTQL